MTETEVRDVDNLLARIAERRRQRLRDRIELLRLERSSWLVCAFRGCVEPTAWIVALRAGQRALCALHASEAVAQGRGVVAVEAFLPAER